MLADEPSLPECDQEGLDLVSDGLQVFDEDAEVSTKSTPECQYDVDATPNGLVNAASAGVFWMQE